MIQEMLQEYPINIENLNDKELSINDKNKFEKNKLNLINELLNQIDTTKYEFEIAYGLEHIYKFFEPTNELLIELNSIQEKININKENIIKLNICNFMNGLKNYVIKKNLDSDIEIEISFNTPSDNEYKLIDKIKKISNYDIIIKIFSKNYRCFEIGFNYSELARYELDDKSYDSNYLIGKSASINLDNYYSYCSKENNFKEFIQKLMYETLIIFYSFLNDEYSLAKIIYYKSIKTEKNSKKEIQMFNKVINYMKEGTFDLELFFEKLMFTNDEGNQIKFEDFILLLKQDLEIDIAFCEGTNLCETKYLEEIINNLEKKNSDLIPVYRKIYSNCLNALKNASKEILKLTNQLNKSKDDLVEYVRINFK